MSSGPVLSQLLAGGGKEVDRPEEPVPTFIPCRSELCGRRISHRLLTKFILARLFGRFTPSGWHNSDRLQMFHAVMLHDTGSRENPNRSLARVPG